MDARRDCTKFYQYPVPSSYSSQPQFQVPIQKARLKSHPIANPHQPSPNVNDSAPRPLFLSAANVNDHRAATHQPLVAARKVLWTSKTLPGDHFSRYGHCQRPRCLLCSSSPTPHFLPGMSIPPPGALFLVPYSTLPSRDASPPPRSPAPFPWCPLRRRGPAPNVNDYRAATKSPQPLLHNAFPGCQSPPPEPCPFPVVPTQAPRASAKRQRLPRG